MNAINRAPLDRAATEAIYEVRLTAKTEHLDDGRELLRQQLETANYLPQGIEVIEREQVGAELVATLAGTTSDPHELDDIVSPLEKIRPSTARARACERRNERSCVVDSGPVSSGRSGSNACPISSSCFGSRSRTTCRSRADRSSTTAAASLRPEPMLPWWRSPEEERPPELFQAADAP